MRKKNLFFDTTTKSDSLWVMRQKDPLHEDNHEHVNQRSRRTKGLRIKDKVVGLKKKKKEKQK